MFLGQYLYTIDERGRLTIPVRYREALSAHRVVVTRGLDCCLTLYPWEVWDEIAQKVNALPITDPRGRALRRVFFADADATEPDRQGRIVIPARLLNYAGLSIPSDVVVVGLDRFIEIWQPQSWETENARQLAQMNADAALWENVRI